MSDPHLHLILTQQQLARSIRTGEPLPHLFGQPAAGRLPWSHVRRWPVVRVRRRWLHRVVPASLRRRAHGASWAREGAAVARS